MSTNNENYLRLFKKLESLLGMDENNNLKDAYDKAMKKDNRLKQFKKELNILKNMRNIEAHNQNSDDYVKIDKKSFDLLNDIIKILEKPLVSYDVATKNVTNRDLKDNVLEAVELMRKNKFSYLPINDKGKFFGVFSAEVLFNYFYDTGETFLDNTITFKTLEDYLTISKHVNENFSFKSRKYLVSKIEDEFMSSYKDNKSLSAVFVTENGNKEEKIIGIITAWDVLNSYSK